jgi:hypothetical protein
MQNTALKFPVRTIITAVGLLIFGTLTLLNALMLIGTEGSPWWATVIPTITGVAMVVTSLVFLVKRNPDTYSLVIAAFWLALGLQLMILFLNKDEIRAELSSDPDVALGFLAGMGYQVVAVASLYFIGIKASVSKKLWAWWLEVHPELKVKEAPVDTEADRT